MKKFKKCFSALFLSCFLAFGNVSGCYLEVQAFEWVAPAIGIEEALKALLLLLGVSVGAKVGEEVDWDTLKQDCITFQENQGNSQVAVSQWWSDIISGKLNQASECWASFKEWVKSTFAFNSVGASPVVSSAILSVNPDFITSSIPVDIYTFDFNVATYYVKNGIYFFDFYNNANVTKISDVLEMHPISGNISYCSLRFNASSLALVSSQGVNNTNYLRNALEYGEYIYGVENLPTAYHYNYWDLSSPSVNENFIYNPNIIDDLSLALQNAISTAIPDVIPLPWENLGDDVSAINDKIDAVIEAVNSGSLDIADAMQRILDALNVMAIDTSTDIVYPSNPDKPDGQPDETLQDKVNENKDNMGFTLAGFEKVFPFCIPFDIYAFMTLLVAEPVAPVIRYPIYNPVTKENNEIVLDFSEWESVTVLFRYIFDFLFIIGLLLSARALIGGGDKA